MTARLSLATLDQAHGGVARPRFDPAALRTGIVHLGVGAFHRAHQAVFTEDAIHTAGGDWGVVGVSLRRPDVPAALNPQDGLYTLETLGQQPRYRLIGVLRSALTAPQHPPAVIAALASPATHVVTLTVTEKGYALDPDRSSMPGRPHTAMEWLVEGLSRRYRDKAAPITIISCDNLRRNGEQLRQGVVSIAAARDAGLAKWIADEIAFPETMVDSIVPATDSASAARVEQALGLADLASVQREPFSQWVIEDRFAGPRPAWERVGADIVGEVAPFERLKLHVLNAAHSALAYLGAPRGHRFVREAIADQALRHGLEQMVRTEIAPALAPLDAWRYWSTVRARFENPMIDHALAQIAQDGSAKLAQRVFPLLIANARAGLPTQGLAGVVHAWLDYVRANSPVIDPQAAVLAEWARSGAEGRTLLTDTRLFPDPFRREPAVRTALGF